VCAGTTPDAPANVGGNLLAAMSHSGSIALSGSAARLKAQRGGVDCTWPQLIQPRSRNLILSCSAIASAVALLAESVDKRIGGMAVKEAAQIQWGDAEAAMDYWAQKITERAVALGAGTPAAASQSSASK
jgi:hypothetical protein